MLFLGIPLPRHLEAAGPLDALGIARAARAMSPSAMEAELEPVGRFLASLRAPVLHYKCCSTFDSSPVVGGLGASMRVFERSLRNDSVPVVGGRPSLARYRALGNLFARMGEGGARRTVSIVIRR
jgi:uncharacterized protein YgbK (DUF1537 family)